MIDITTLSEEERKELLKQASALAKKEKELKAEERKSFKELSEEFVTRNIDKLIEHNSLTEGLIKNLCQDFKPIQELKASAYGNQINKQDSHTSTLADGSASITIGYNVSIGFDGTETEGVEKIKQFITSLAGDSDKVKKLSKMVNTFLKPNAKTGMLNPSKIIELSKLRDEFNDETFNEGLRIIFDAQIRRQNSMYVSGWKFIKIDEIPTKVEFRFTI